MESNGAPPQWFVVFVRLLLQVQKAAVSWQTITGRLKASVFSISIPVGPMGMGKRQTKKTLNLFHLFSLITDYNTFISLSFFPSFDPVLLVPFLTVVTILHVFCICVINTQDL